MDKTIYGHLGVSELCVARLVLTFKIWKKGRLRFRGVRFQAPSSVSLLGSLSSGERAQRVPLGLLFVCQSELTEFDAELTDFAAELSEFFLPKPVLSKQYSARFQKMLGRHVCRSQETWRGLKTHGSKSSMEDWDAELSPCNFATTHFPAESPCNFATPRLKTFNFCMSTLFKFATHQKWRVHSQRPKKEAAPPEKKKINTKNDTKMAKKSGRAKRETAKGRNRTRNAHFRRFLQIFADFRLAL